MAGGTDDDDRERRRYVMALPTSALRRRAVLVAPAANDRLVTFSVSADDDLDVLRPRSRDRPGKIRHGRTSRPVDVRLTVHGGGETVVRRIGPVCLTFPDDQVLVVGNRCVWRGSGPLHTVGFTPRWPTETGRAGDQVRWR